MENYPYLPAKSLIKSLGNVLNKVHLVGHQDKLLYLGIELGLGSTARCPVKHIVLQRSSRNVSNFRCHFTIPRNPKMDAISFDSYACEPNRANRESHANFLMVPSVVPSLPSIECIDLAMHLPEPA